MSDIEKMQTKSKIYWENGDRYRITVKYGMHKIGEQIPHFSITADVYRQARNNRWVEHSFGSQHKLIAKHFPELAPLIRLHLCDQNGTPMHYFANAKYFYEGSEGKTNIIDALGSFCDIVVWDLGNDVLLEMIRKFDSIDDFLDWRLPFIQQEFYGTMQAFGVEYIGEPPIIQK